MTLEKTILEILGIASDELELMNTAECSKSLETLEPNPDIIIRKGTH